MNFGEEGVEGVEGEVTQEKIEVVWAIFTVAEPVKEKAVIKNGNAPFLNARVYYSNSVLTKLARCFVRNANGTGQVSKRHLRRV